MALDAMHSTKTAGDCRLYFQGHSEIRPVTKPGFPAISDCNHRPCDIDPEKGAPNSDESEGLPWERLS